MRKRDRTKLFLDEVSQALGLEDPQIQRRRRFSTGRGDLVAHLFGALNGFAVEAGVHHSQGKVAQPSPTPR